MAELLQLFLLLVGEAITVVAIVPALFGLRLGGLALLLRLLAVVKLFLRAVFAIVAGEVFHHAFAQKHKRVVHRAVHEEAVVAYDYYATVEF